jgi:hypothetical protein
MRTKNEILTELNVQFDVLERLVQEYLDFTRNRGGTLGFCIGSQLEKLREARGRINDMCGKLPPFLYYKK